MTTRQAAPRLGVNHGTVANYCLIGRRAPLQRVGLLYLDAVKVQQKNGKWAWDISVVAIRAFLARRRA